MIGWVLSTAASIIYILNHKVVMFAILYSIGQIINITGYIYIETDLVFYPALKLKSKIWLSVLEYF